MQARISKLAIWSMVAGFLFFIPVLSGIVAIALGSLALYRIASHKRSLKGSGLATAGIVLGTAQMVVIVIISSLFAWSSTAIFRSGISDSYYLRKALKYQRVGNHKLAIDYYDKTLNKLSREEATARHGLGSVYMDQKEFNDALEEFDKAIAINPKMYDAHQNKAVTFRRMGRYQDSVDTCQALLELFPESAKTYCSLGWAYEKLEDYPEAIKAHMQAIALSPYWKFPKSKISYCFSQLKDENLSSEFLRELEAIDKPLAKRIRAELDSK